MIDQNKQASNAWKFLKSFYVEVHKVYSEIYKNNLYIEKGFGPNKMSAILPKFFNGTDDCVLITNHYHLPRNIFEDQISVVFSNSSAALYDDLTAVINSNKEHLLFSKCRIDLAKKNHWFCDKNIIDYLDHLKNRTESDRLNNSDKSVDAGNCSAKNNLISTKQPLITKLECEINSQGNHICRVSNDIVTGSNEHSKMSGSKHQSSGGTVSYVATFPQTNHDYNDCMRIRDKNIKLSTIFPKTGIINQKCVIGRVSPGSMLELKCREDKDSVCNKMITQDCDLVLGVNFNFFSLDTLFQSDHLACHALMNGYIDMAGFMMD